MKAGLARRLVYLEVAMRPEEHSQIVVRLRGPDDPPTPGAIRARVALPPQAPAIICIQTPGG
jgi:hypothetical protein